MTLEQDFRQAYEASKNFVSEFMRPSWDARDWKRIFSEFNKLLEFRTFREIYMALISFAISRQAVSYGELARFVNRRLGEDVIPTKGSWLGRSLGEILGAINLYEFAAGRPLISVVVYNATTKKPGDGFSRLVATMGLKIKENCEKERVFIAWGGYNRR